MAKSFCSGCKHWQYIRGAENFDGKGFHYCDKFSQGFKLKIRKKMCNGKLKE